MKREAKTLSSGTEVRIRTIGPRAKLELLGLFPSGVVAQAVEDLEDGADLADLKQADLAAIVKKLGQTGIEALSQKSREARILLVTSCSEVRPDPKGEFVRLTEDNLDELLDWDEFQELETLVRELNRAREARTVPFSDRKTGTD